MSILALQLFMQFDYSYKQMILANRKKDAESESRHLINCLGFYQKLFTFGSPKQVEMADFKLDMVLL